MDDELTKMFSRYLTGWAMSKAILEDYSEVIAKIESTTPELVKDRIMKNTQEFFDQAKLKPKDE
jgi:Tat protein secretion system quality control protein TatD with DNase activity